MAFESRATNLPNGAAHAEDKVYIHDRKSGRTRLVSVTSGGAPANAVVDLDSTHRSVSSGGTFVVFGTQATNLPGGTGEPPGVDLIYVRGPLSWPR